MMVWLRKLLSLLIVKYIILCTCLLVRGKLNLNTQQTILSSIHLHTFINKLSLYQLNSMMYISELILYIVHIHIIADTNDIIGYTQTHTI